MPRWVLKAALQGFLSHLPGGRSINRLFQKHVTRSLDLTAPRFEEKIRQCRTHLENFYSAAPPGRFPARVFELGTGWHPVIPVGFYLCGARDVWTADKERLLDRGSVMRVLRMYLEHAWSGALDGLLPGVMKQRIARLESVLRSAGSSSPSDLLEQIDVHFVVGDVRHSKLKESSIDLIMSNYTLEHIPLDVLRGIMMELRRLASGGAVVSHLIDLSDHYSHFDRSISSLNFLKYPGWLWNLCNNSLQYQNRLRIPDYRTLHESAGFRVVAEENVRDPKGLARGTRAARGLAECTIDEMRVTESWMVLVPDREPPQPGETPVAGLVSLRDAPAQKKSWDASFQRK